MVLYHIMPFKNNLEIAIKFYIAITEKYHKKE